jgi:hypothetical protein
LHISGRFSLIRDEFVVFQVEMRGLSGPIEFKEGRRIQFKLDLLKLKQHALVKVGEWSPGAGVNITDRSAFFDPGTINVTLVVITIPVSHVQLLCLVRSLSDLLSVSLCTICILNKCT